MATPSIHPHTTLGSVHLTVSNLERALGFYQTSLGFKLHQRTDSTATLGAGQADLLELTEQPGAKRVAGTTGLYHFALLLPSRQQLARLLKHIIQERVLVDGFADHLVSEAIYLRDPDGNGIELYRDRPRQEWIFENDTLKMTTDPLDVEDLLATAGSDPAPWSSLPPETVVGHIHLHVAELARAERFYREQLGFDLMVRYGSTATFLSAGGYHHHIGLNIWAGPGAPPPPADAVGLRWFVIQLPAQAELERIEKRLQQSELEWEARGNGLFLRDPAQNGILLQATPEAAL